jgi:ATP-dependent protease ClpP protease subunit
MIGTIYITGEIGLDTTLLDVIKQVKAQASCDSYLVRIHSIGGFVDAGEAIYQYLTNLDKPITTYATQAYSIASVIFMAGDQRIVPEGLEKTIMIHLPWMEVAGSHDAITAHLSDLKATEDKLVKFYSESLQIDKNTIQSLLTQETYLSAEQAFELGFANQIQPAQKAVAKLNNKETEEQNSFMNKLEKQI